MRRIALVIALIAQASVAAAHTLGTPDPFHVSPGDLFKIPVTGGTFASPTGITVHFTPFGGGTAVEATPESVVANASVSVRVPAALAGQSTLGVTVAAVDSSGTAPSVWIRSRTFRFIGHPAAYLSGNPSASAADFKEVEFADVNGDGF